MRFPSTDHHFAIIRLGDGRPIKVDAADADQLPDGAYEFNDVLFDLLCSAFEHDDNAALDRLWAAAHKHIRVTTA